MFEWREKVWGRRYSAITVSDEAEAQIARLRYVLAHGVKEHLVARCMDWPGVHAAEALTTGRALVGYWFDRTAEYGERLRGKDFGPYTHAKLEPLSFDPLPCWRHLDAGTYQAHVADMVASIEADAAAIVVRAASPRSASKPSNARTPNDVPNESNGHPHPRSTPRASALG